MSASRWLVSPRFDLAWFIAPLFLPALLVLVFPELVAHAASQPDWVWLLLIVGVDVGHVWSTVFRTYLDREEFAARRSLYLWAPLLGLAGGCLLYSLGAMVFWRTLAYLAIFHFVRQQYGFFMLYRRGEQVSPGVLRQEKALIYLSTLWPLLYWHAQGRSFNWFVAGDVYRWNLDIPLLLTGILYGVLAALQLWRLVRQWHAGSGINWPKQLWLTGTALSWGVGIVLFDNDLAFTATNVLSHGIPYLALVWLYGNRQEAITPPVHRYRWPALRLLFRPAGALLLIALVYALGWGEEALWDRLVWREHPEIFAALDLWLRPAAEDMLVWLVPLLALPQLTHYLLDAVIWRLHAPGTVWARVLLPSGGRAPAARE
ncbi:hypothetical protein [Chitinilyticum piscinae]|uniref:Uncharacterized protein n=1 Tax=Chitinilyticum piscinae TaxID=2866724 RepID=A0A8J7FHX1_9NEIS|nr:hypothetical protein [Chitinilyticum piscinae]MBE9608087.1 hypothetical protein [Chitinilyticum piscinae]